MSQFVTRNVVLEPRDIETVNQKARDEGFGPKGFSVALRVIIREWENLKKEVDSENINQEKE